LAGAFAREHRINLIKKGTQMTTRKCWCPLWPVGIQKVYWYRAANLICGLSHKGSLWRGLSRMMGNYQVRFWGGNRAARPVTYPVQRNKQYYISNYWQLQQPCYFWEIHCRYLGGRNSGYG